MTRSRGRWIGAVAAASIGVLIGAALLTRSCWNPSGSRQGRVAAAFARALASGRYEEAHRLLSRKLASESDVAELRRQYESMIGYGEGPATNVMVMFAMDHWPDEQSGDVGWAHVAIWGEGFSEAVTVVVADEEGRAVIRVLEWGRP